MRRDGARGVGLGELWTLSPAQAFGSEGGSQVSRTCPLDSFHLFLDPGCKSKKWQASILASNSPLGFSSCLMCLSQRSHKNPLRIGLFPGQVGVVACLPFLSWSQAVLAGKPW